MSLTLVALLFLAGCGWPRAFSRSNASKTDVAQNPAATSSQPPLAGGPNANTPGNPAAANRGPAGSATAGDSGASPQSMQAIIAELQQMGALDAKSQQRLTADLQNTDPSLWPLLVQSFKASLAYQKKQQQNANALPAVVASDEEAPRGAPLANHAQREGNSAASRSQNNRVADSRAAAPTTPPQIAPPNSSDVPPVNQSFPPLVQPASDQISVPLPNAPFSSNAAQQEPAVAPLPPTEARALQSTGQRSDIQQVKYEQPLADSPQSNKSVDENLAAAITALEAQTQEPPKSADEVSRHARLRMLYLSAGRRDDALRPIPGISAAQQDFWSKQVYGLATLLDTERTPDAAKRSAEARQHLTLAASRLGELGTLVVRNLNFCTEVFSYGGFTRFEKNEFHPNQQVLLYSEVENFKSEETPKGFHTSLRSSYQILDSQGHRVAADDFPVTEEHCINHRHDYFLRYFLFLPERIYDGKYTLQLTIEDTKSQKIGQSSIEFTIKQK
jgi:hypothetical protein